MRVRSGAMRQDSRLRSAPIRKAFGSSMMTSWASAVSQGSLKPCASGVLPTAPVAVEATIGESSVLSTAPEKRFGIRAGLRKG
eukprot:2650917-Amphidinium_carterae.1